MLARRDVLLLLATGAGTVLGGGSAAARRSRPPWRAPRSPWGMAFTAEAPPSCVVRPEQTQGPYFVDEKLLRSDIRSDPSDGSVRPGTPLTVTFAVSRLDGATCTPFEGVLVDVWHCDALGVYSDVVDPSFDTTGRKFLRGYQMTDAAGLATFVTIYPGWYSGRTVHIHFKLRTGPSAETAVEFTSQVYFDDALTDVVHAAEPYASKGERIVRNPDDAIYRLSGSQLTLTVVADGMEGHVAAFDIGIQMSGSGSCATIPDCVAALRAVLPDPASAVDAKTRRTARRVRRRADRVAGLLERAASGGGASQANRYAKARMRLAGLLTRCRQAAAAGTLGVALAPIAAAIDALVALLPA